MRAVKVEALSPCSQVQIQYVSIACTCFGSASPRHSSRKRSAVVFPCAIACGAMRSSSPVGEPRRLRGDRDELRRDAAQVLARLVVGDVDQLLEPPLAAERAAVTACRSAGVLPVRPPPS